MITVIWYRRFLKTFSYGSVLRQSKTILPGFFPWKIQKHENAVKSYKWLLPIGFLTEFCYKQVLRNRDKDNFVIRKIKWSYCGIRLHVAKRNETRRKSTSLRNKRTVLKFLSQKVSGPQQPLLNQSSSTLLTRPLWFSPSDSAPSASTPPTPPPPHLPLRLNPSYSPPPTPRLRPLRINPSDSVPSHFRPPTPTPLLLPLHLGPPPSILPLRLRPFACTPPTPHIIFRIFWW
jgi:hypothetical protein